MPALPVGAAFNPRTGQWYYQDARNTGSGGAWGPDGKVVSPKSSAKTVAKSVVKKAAKTAPKKPGINFDTWFNSLKSAGTSLPDYSSMLPGMPPLQGYTGPTVPDYGQTVSGSNFPAFQAGRTTSVDPTAYATQAGKSFTPLLDSLAQQKAGYQAGIAQGTSQIDAAYGSAKDLAAQSRDRILQAGQASQAASAATTRNLLAGAGGGEVAGQALAQSQGAGDAYSNAMAQIEAQGAGDSAAAAERQRVAANLDYTNAANSKINDLATAIGTTQRDQNDAKQKALMDALSFNDQMKTSGLNRDISAQGAALAAQLAGPQITAQKLQNAAARSGLSDAAVKSLMGAVDMNNTINQNQFNNGLSLVTSKAQLDQIVQAAKQSGLDISKMPAATRALADNAEFGDLEKRFITPVMGDDNVSTINPRKLYDQVFSNINAMDKKTPKNLRAQLARQLVQGTLARYNTKAKAAGAGEWYWDGNTFSQRKGTGKK